MIEAIIAPILAAILFIMPVVAIKLVPSMKRYRSPWNIFTLVAGFVIITGFIIS